MDKYIDCLISAWKCVEIYRPHIILTLVLVANMGIFIILFKKLNGQRSKTKTLQKDIHNVHCDIYNKKEQLGNLKNEFNEAVYNKKKKSLESKIVYVMNRDKRRIEQRLSQRIDDLRDVLHNYEYRISELMTKIEDNKEKIRRKENEEEEKRKEKEERRERNLWLHE